MASSPYAAHTDTNPEFLHRRISKKFHKILKNFSGPSWKILKKNIQKIPELNEKMDEKIFENPSEFLKNYEIFSIEFHNLLQNPVFFCKKLSENDDDFDLCLFMDSIIITFSNLISFNMHELFKGSNSPLLEKAAGLLTQALACLDLSKNDKIDRVIKANNLIDKFHKLSIKAGSDNVFVAFEAAKTAFSTAKSSEEIENANLLKIEAKKKYRTWCLLALLYHAKHPHYVFVDHKTDYPEPYKCTPDEELTVCFLKEQITTSFEILDIYSLSESSTSHFRRELQILLNKTDCCDSDKITLCYLLSSICRFKKYL